MRKESQEKELAFLESEREKNPELFAPASQVDDAVFLETIGIFFPEKLAKNLQPGQVKYLPQDFIVEEVLRGGATQTIDLPVTENTALQSEGSTIYATLVKCGLSTIEAIEEIATVLGIDKKNVQYAGIKDKDAITSQLISMRGTTIEKVQHITSPYFFLKDIYASKAVMEIGGLQGNTFTLLVRTKKDFNKAAFLENIDFVKQQGFYNFYYSQRFGSPRYINWFWGLQILKGEYQKAVLSILCSEGQREIAYFKNLRKELKNHFGDWEAMEKLLLPFTSLSSENAIVKHLKNNPTDFLGALKQVPEQVNLWVFAYSSLLFNRTISHYLHKEKPLPKTFNLILSRNGSDWELYKEALEEDGITSIPKDTLKPFPSIIWKPRSVATQEKVDIGAIEFLEEGVALTFTLPKGCYATSFLSHLFTLSTDALSTDFLKNEVDTKKALGQNNQQELFKKFSDVLSLKSRESL